ncbi:uncharacterized protein LOC129701504 [Leucoraja erinacea]|uniref:uncharacterized protein LOC129701504 n=1 Tax=Leucoraja erinaceus TaxID=7782 RepID=UPI0024564A02|nr:uncharacterized protein LOC129701504 [Leucoraja erinacea]
MGRLFGIESQHSTQPSHVLSSETLCTACEQGAWVESVVSSTPPTKFKSKAGEDSLAPTIVSPAENNVGDQGARRKVPQKWVLKLIGKPSGELEESFLKYRDSGFRKSSFSEGETAGGYEIADPAIAEILISEQIPDVMDMERIPCRHFPSRKLPTLPLELDPAVGADYPRATDIHVRMQSGSMAAKSFQRPILRIQKRKVTSKEEEEFKAWIPPDYLRDMPIREPTFPQFGWRGYKAVRHDQCYICGESGSWSRSCPVREHRGGRGQRRGPRGLRSQWIPRGYRDTWDSEDRGREHWPGDQGTGTFWQPNPFR